MQFTVCVCVCTVRVHCIHETDRQCTNATVHCVCKQMLQQQQQQRKKRQTNKHPKERKMWCLCRLLFVSICVCVFNVCKPITTVWLWYAHSTVAWLQIKWSECVCGAVCAHMSIYLVCCAREHSTNGVCVCVIYDESSIYYMLAHMRPEGPTTAASCQCASIKCKATWQAHEYYIML